MNPALPPRPDLARLVVDLCRLRGGPQDFPYSPKLLVALFVAGTALDTLGGSFNVDAGAALASSLLSTGVVLALCWIALAIRGLRNRFMQTAGALLACSIALSLLSLPITWLYEPSDAIGAIVSPGHVMTQWFVSWAIFGLFVWQIVVNAHITRSAMDSSFGFALVLVIVWQVVYLSFAQLLPGVT